MKNLKTKLLNIQLEIKYTNHLLNKYDIVADDIISLSKHKVKEICYSKWLSSVNVEYPIYAEIIKDMIVMRERRCTKLFSNGDY